jgi:protein-L-isoaspartate(D-aspartate) O-methyltransferase
VDNFTVKTFLRPDFYEYFPKFSSFDISNRLSWANFSKATLLSVANIETGLRTEFLSSNIVRSFLESSPECQIQQMTEVLSSVGIRKTVVDAIRKVPRHFYCPSRDTPFAYLDASLFFGDFSCLSAPSIVSLMLDRLNPSRGMRILDIGCGSCYHAHCVSELCSNDCEICGLEINRDFLKLAESALAKTGLKTIKVSHGDASKGWPDGGKFDALYGAVAMENGVPQTLLHQVIDGGFIQFTRPLTQGEFYSEPDKSWLRMTFDSFPDYSRSWRSFCCLVTGKRKGDQVVELDQLYDVSFVPFHGEQSGAMKRPQHIDNLESLRRLLD